MTAFRSLLRSPTLHGAIVLTLATSLAAAVLVFSFLNSYLLRPLPYGDSARLAVIYEQSIVGGRGNFSRVAYGNFAAIQERATSFSRLGLLRNESATFHGGDTTETAFLQRVTAEVFPLLGARAALGSVITPANQEIGGVRTIVLSDSLWRRRFGADPAIVGRTIRLDATPFHVVGVMPATFTIPTFDDGPQAWAALLPSDIVRTERTQRRHHLWAELAPGKSLAVATAELESIATALRQEFPKENADRTFFAFSIRDDLLGGFGQQLLLLQGAVLLVLAVACFNCLCLLIARAIQRRRELALRLALGASRRHLLAQLLGESLWLSLPAAVLALLLAAFALPHAASLLPTAAQVSLQSLPAPQLDARVALTVIGAAVLIALVFSAVPLLQTRKLNLEATLREGGRSSGSPGGARAARILATAQIAVALALLISAALLVRSQQALQRVDPGIPIAELDQFRIGLRGNQYLTDPALRTRFFENLRDNLRTLPGVRDVGVVSFLFAQPPGGYQGFVQESDGILLAETPKRALPCYVLPGSLEALGFRIVEGRTLAETDTTGRPDVVVISASLAAKYWPDQSALGRRVQLAAHGERWFEVVGVASDLTGPGNQPRVVDTFYLTLAQGQPPGLGMGFLVRHSGVAPDRRAYDRVLAQLDPSLQLFAHLSPTRIYQNSAWQSRFVTQLVGSFALLAVVLCLGGIYAVNSFFVARRIGEFGIRAALGATRRDLFALVFRGSLRLAVIGLAVGMLLAFAASRTFARLLYEVPPLDPLVYASATFAMLLACGLATLLPARRAAQADPITALRSE